MWVITVTIARPQWSRRRPRACVRHLPHLTSFALQLLVLIKTYRLLWIFLNRFHVCFRDFFLNSGLDLKREISNIFFSLLERILLFFLNCCQLIYRLIRSIYFCSHSENNQLKILLNHICLDRRQITHKSANTGFLYRKCHPRSTRFSRFFLFFTLTQHGTTSIIP